MQISPQTKIPLQRLATSKARNPLQLWRSSVSGEQTTRPPYLVNNTSLPSSSTLQITWMTYTTEMVEELPPAGREHYRIWRARVPLICFDIVELHLPDRVLRQFGYEQVIP
ncbi:unnamed protein product, partial [Cuscuta epithymum]